MSPICYCGQIAGGSTACLLRRPPASCEYNLFKYIVAELVMYWYLHCATGVVLGTYEDTRFKSESKKPLLRSVDLLGLGNIAQLEGQLAQTVHQCAGVMLAKQLVNAPPNVLIPSKHYSVKKIPCVITTFVFPSACEV